MNHFMKGIGLLLVLSTSAYAAKTQVKSDVTNFTLPQIEQASFEDPAFMKEKKEWTKLKRKLASNMSFANSDMSPDLQKIREEWLKCKSGDEMEVLLKKTYANYDSYSEDSKYFLAQLHTALPFRGIIWKLRPLFENSKGFMGNKSTHVTAVQAVRTTITALKTLLPTQQTDAAIQYFTEPSVEMTKDDQFTSISQFQNYMVEKFIPVLTESTSKILAITKNGGSQKTFVWDNKMAFGRGTFEDDIQRFVGHGPAEMNFVIATLYRTYHNVLVYCAYNQDYAIKLAGEVGSHFGIDSSMFASKREDLGISDKERIGLVRSAAQNHGYLSLRANGENLVGRTYLRQAYVALSNSVVYSERSYEYLQGRDPAQGMSLNPIMFQQDVAPNLDKGIKNMKAVVQGPAEVRDPVSGDTVTINLPAFYQDPPQSLSALMPTNFEGGEVQKTIKNKKGEALVVRNYLHGRSIAWDNGSWKKYVPSAENQKAGYMSEARRIIKYSFGTSMVFGLPEMFVH